MIWKDDPSVLVKSCPGCYHPQIFPRDCVIPSQCDICKNTYPTVEPTEYTLTLDYLIRYTNWRRQAIQAFNPKAGSWEMIDSKIIGPSNERFSIVLPSTIKFVIADGEVKTIRLKVKTESNIGYYAYFDLFNLISSSVVYSPYMWTAISGYKVLGSEDDLVTANSKVLMFRSRATGGTSRIEVDFTFRLDN